MLDEKTDMYIRLYCQGTVALTCEWILGKYKASPEELGKELIMSVAIRYYSRSGNTKEVAEAIAKAAGVSAVSVDAGDAKLSQPVDVLFVGGALYAYGIDSHLKDYLKTLNKNDAKKAVVFSTSWISKHSIDLIKKGLEEAGITVVEESFYVKSKPSEEQLKEAADFARKYI